MKRIPLLSLFVLLLPTAIHADTLQQLFKRVNPSVVVVHVEERTATRRRGMTTVPGLGSGVLISEDGLVFTAAHVVQTADTVEVEFLDGQTIWAEVVASEPKADVALLKLREVPEGAVIAKVADSDRVNVGDQVFVIGAPLGLSHTLTVGHISARHTSGDAAGELTLGEFFQTDAAINQGNSGGPMFNMDGEVIGIVSHIMTLSGGFDGLGFVATSNMAMHWLVHHRSMWTGLQGRLVMGETAKALNIPQAAGFLVEQVAKRSPAASLGLQGGKVRAVIKGEEVILGGDILLEVQGLNIAQKDSYKKIQEALAKLRPGDELQVVVLRAGKIVKLTDVRLE